MTHAFDLWASESALARLSEPQRYSALFAVRETLLAWRFYHQFRTDDASPLRRAQVLAPRAGAGHSVLFTTAAQLLLDLGAQESARALDQRLRHYCARTGLLVID